MNNRIQTGLLLLALGMAVPAWGEDPNWLMWKGEVAFSGGLDEFRAMKILPYKDPKQKRIVYGDMRGRLHILQYLKNGFREEWTSPNLKSAVMEVFVEDMDGDGRMEIVAYTERGKIVFYDPEDYQLIWQNQETDFKAITTLKIDDVDDDPNKELVFCADNRANENDRPQYHLYIYDGKGRFQEWVSEQEYPLVQKSASVASSGGPTDLVIGDLDGDGEKDIVLNSGYVIDARFKTVKWHSTEPFGEQMGLLDVDSDGIPEIIAQVSGRFLKVFSVVQRREKL
ncbi:MAG: VCBS repeat-containing protein [Candidatus Latescibacteria bacterium]|nr:VCBS repeat-containing protein [Candidatus Latescibacterota bacterium]